MSFQILGLAEPITRALIEERYETPTPIQTAAIPPVLSGRDLIGIAQTGTGKTAAFALPILHRLAAAPARANPKSFRVLVLSPTRELSSQIVDSFQTYGRHLRLSVRLAIGGVPIGKQVRALAHGADILVATPGRLIDLCNTRAVLLNQVEVLVLDEADRMLDMGFIRDIRRIVAMLPKERQTLFFSATMPAEIARLAGEMLNDPARVAVTPAATTADRVEQRVIHIDRASKPDHLARMLKGGDIDRSLIFTRTKHGADKVVRALVKAGVEAEAIHGNKSQGQRERALGAFRDGRVRTLVATDIAARGIDVDGISHVINYDLPNIPESYVHRIGRTARAGNAGIAISFCSSDEAEFLRDIERLIKQKIPATHIGRSRAPAAEAVAAPQQPQRSEGDRPSQSRQRPQGDRPAQARQRPDGDRPSQSRQRPQGDRASQGRHPEGDRPSQSRQRPEGDRTAQARQHPEGDRPSRGRSRNQRQGAAPQGERPAGGRGGRHQRGGPVRFDRQPHNGDDIARIAFLKSSRRDGSTPPSGPAG